MNELELLQPISDADIERNKQLGFPDLNSQKKQFCRKYLETFNPRRAAQECGLTISTAHMLVREPLVAAFIEYLEAQYSERSFLTKELVIMEQLETLEKLQGREEVNMVDKDGLEFKAKRFHAGETVKMLADLAKQTGASKASGGAGSGVTVHINMGAMGVKEKSVTIEGESETVEPEDD